MCGVFLSCKNSPWKARWKDGHRTGKIIKTTSLEDTWQQHESWEAAPSKCCKRMEELEGWPKGSIKYRWDQKMTEAWQPGDGPPRDDVITQLTTPGHSEEEKGRQGTWTARSVEKKDFRRQSKDPSCAFSWWYQCLVLPREKSWIRTFPNYGFLLKHIRAGVSQYTFATLYQCQNHHVSNMF